MKLSEFIQQAQQMAGDTDPELILFNKTEEIELRNDPNEGDEGVWDFELMRGEGQLVIEFD